MNAACGMSGQFSNIMGTGKYQYEAEFIIEYCYLLKATGYGQYRVKYAAQKLLNIKESNECGEMEIGVRKKSKAKLVPTNSWEGI